ncbi:hypothetical protein [Aquimarina sp. 2201CG5-10]|uniref:hypothetical protein n=1 Tax=Aquimarina callyspongiae TaxID=3098150 RepID=UPI002AB5BE8A|nr:hypothetical protein [Aquimarina sp. 2201CG5-10]MDY8136646.1 hypothetical protein [Aquimarina sp. 2201CG5-10]
MKPKTLPLFVFLFSFLISFSQQELNQDQMRWTKGWTNFDPNHEDYPKPEEKLLTIIDNDAYLSNDAVYLMSGNVYVTNNATLTIQEGTIIRCDSENETSLVITKGAKLIAKGSKVNPIIFTSDKAPKSRKAGDWGGIVIAGSGKTSSPSGVGVLEGNFLPQYSVYGGTKPNEMTAILSYIRIEYAGKKINQSKELNGLSLYALGKNSIIKNIMVSFSADDSYECYGGLANLKNLISYKAKDDDFDLTQGYQGELFNILAVRHPYISDISGSYAIEIDGYDKKQGFSSPELLSFVKIRNATLINLSDRSNYQHTSAAISSKYLARLSMGESRISGFANVIKFDKSYQTYADLEKSFSLENSIFNVHSTAVKVKYASQDDAQKILKYNMFTTQFKNVEELFQDPLNDENPRFSLKESLGNYTVKQ